MRLRVASTPEQAAVEAAAHIAAVLGEALIARGRATLALSGGTRVPTLFAALARAAINWSAIHVFQVDERVAARDSDARNLTAIERALVSGGSLPLANLHPMPVDELALDAAPARYAQILSRYAGCPPVLDVAQLGLGADGHTASLFQGDSASLPGANGVALTGVHAGYRRMTLTLPVLNDARAVVWFATGVEKAEIVARLAAGNLDAPAGRVQGLRGMLFADAAAGRYV